MRDKKTTRFNGVKNPHLTAALFVAIFAVGALFVWWITMQADGDMRTVLLQQARLVAQPVNVERVMALSGTEADMDSPGYRRIKEHLVAVRSANSQYRFLYIMGRRADGVIFFIADSEPVGSKDYSPPGQVYEEAPEGYRRVFDSKSAAIEGPVTDRWGVWVSALVPLTDPETGSVVAVLGMDIDARGWKWDVTAHTALPVGLMLLLLVGIASAVVSTSGAGASPKPVLRRMLPPMAAMVIIMTVGAYVILYQQYRQQLSGEIATNISVVSGNLLTALEQQAFGLSMAIQPIVANATVQRAMREGDADRLLADWQPVFETMHWQNKLTQFHFLDTNRVSLMRVHKPEQHGDIITRFTVLKAEQTGKTAFGLELGLLGTFALRVVQPVFEGGVLVGYLELGKDIADIMQTIDNQSGNQLAVVIHKEYLNRQADWDFLPHNVVIYASNNRLPDVFASWADQTASEQADGGTSREIAFDGKDWLVSAAPLHDASVKEVGNLLIMRDISTQKAAFVRLMVLGGTGGAMLLTLLLGVIYILLRRTDAGIHAQQVELLEISAAVEQSPVSIIITDTTGAIEYVNPKFTETTGYTFDEVRGQNSSILKSGSFPDEAYKKLWNTILAGEIWRGEFQNKKKNGELFWEQTSISPIRDEQGVITSFVAVYENITNRKRAEAELHETNQQLEAATVRAEMASSAKSEFLANMSHEIRTPMNGVIGMTGLLLDTELNDEQRRYVEIVRDSGKSLLGLINDILDFSKIEAKKLDLETLDFDLSSLLDDFVATLALRAHDKGLELLCAADPDVPTLLRGDPGRLRQILTNLAGNAIKFTHAGEVAIRVSLKEEIGNQGAECIEQGAESRVRETANISFGAEQEGETVMLRFSVRDTGIGIPKDKICLLFEEFSQVDSSTTRQYGGSGLGLAISRQLAELMGGEAGVSSEEGKGSEFWFTARFGKQATGADMENIPLADLRGVRVLIVDDNATSREILTTFMVSWGMRPFEAQDGPKALQALYLALNENDPFRIAVIDMQMPGMDGDTVGRAIKADKRLADTRMVMLTSMGTRGDTRHYQEIGFSAYTTKPIQHRELKAILSLALVDRDQTEPTKPPITTRHTARETLNHRSANDTPGHRSRSEMPGHRSANEMLNLFVGRKSRILLAEDNITNQLVALGILKKFGLRADAVANGVEALRALETLPYDLVLMDVQMPEMDGIEATKRIRKNEKIMMSDECGMMKEEPEKLAAYSSSSSIHHSSIPIIAMTAHVMQGDRERCIKAGMNDYISKPVTPEALAEILEKWLPRENMAIFISQG
jgi:PAS domain S-box-containing protein